MASVTPLLSSLIAAALPPHPSLGESVVYQLNGLIVVIVALCAIWGLLELTGVYFRRVAAATLPIKPEAAASGADAGSATSGVSPEVVAAIAAAVSLSVKGPYRIQGIVPLPPAIEPDETSTVSASTSIR